MASAPLTVRIAMTKLLFVTQVLDVNDSVLGAYHNLVNELAPRFERIEVICLKEGAHTLPKNVRVHSVGKERGSVPALVYAVRFKLLAWKLRHQYDTVFVHMNQEYILIAGPMWRLLGKRIYMWRNHYAGSWLTDIAAAFCTNVLCTSKHSYTAKYKKTLYMPVGVDTQRFTQSLSVERKPHSILFFARIAPSKRADMFIDALAVLHKHGETFQASIYGSPTPSDQEYYEQLQSRVKARGLQEHLAFHPGVPNKDAPAVYQAHDISVNCSPSGMFDKTLFEAAASGCLVLTSSEDFRDIAGNEFYFSTSEELAGQLIERCSASKEATALLQNRLHDVVEQHSLASLCKKLVSVLSA